MNVEKPTLERKRVIENGGWPSWGSENIIFFHRKDGEIWGVFRYNLSTGETIRVTPEGFDAVTPAAIDETKVAVAIIRQKSKFSDIRVEAQYRHIEIFDTRAPEQSVQITRKTRPKSDHFNTFVMDGGRCIGYHRRRSDLLQHGQDLPRSFHKLHSLHEDVGLFRVSGVFPTFSKDGSKLAFVDNEFKAVWLADSQRLRVIYETKGQDSIFSPVWNQKKDILYVCMGPSFKANETSEIYAIPNVSSGARQKRPLTKGKFNNAFPSTNPDDFDDSVVFESDPQQSDDYLQQEKSWPDFLDGSKEADTTTYPMEASLTAAAASSPPPQIHLRIPKPNPLLPPRWLQFGPYKIRTAAFRSHLAAASASTPPTPGGGLYSEETYELTADNVDRVLDDVRPYLIADGGEVTVVSVEDGVVSLKLEGACGSCPSSTTTMKMGIERVLKEKFGDAVKDIRQVFDGDQAPAETAPEAVNGHLDILRPAIANYGGSVEVLAIDGEDCLVKYDGPESIGSGIKAAIKEKFPDITNVVFTQ